MKKAAFDKPATVHESGFLYSPLLDDTIITLFKAYVIGYEWTSLCQNYDIGLHGVLLPAVNRFQQGQNLKHCVKLAGWRRPEPDRQYADGLFAQAVIVAG